MKKGTHGKDKDAFEKLSYSQQASSLNTQILLLEKGIKAHLRKGATEDKDVTTSKDKYLLQLKKLITNLENN